MNLDLIKRRLEDLKSQTANTSTNRDLFWKPDEGKNVIRILPNPNNLDDEPFTELHFYYKFGRTYLAPCVFGNADPVAEFIKELKSTGDKEDWKLSKQLEPTFRVYVPVIVRGKDGDSDIKFWGIGKKLFMEIMNILVDEDYGDITDLKKGHDITVTYTKAVKEGSYPDTELLPKPKPTPATTDVEMIEKIKNMIDVRKEFTEPDYDTLKAALTKYLNNESDDVKNNMPAPKSEEDEIDKFAEEVKKSKSSKPDLDAQFDELFNKK